MTCAPSHLIEPKVGRPRTVSPPPEELESLGIEMVSWLKENPGALHISEWYCLEKFFTENAWKTMIERPEFVGYYEQAKRIIGKKYLDKTSNVREGISQRWQRVYFKDLRDQEDEDAKFNSRLKAEEAVAVDENFNKKFDKFSKAITDAQESSKALKSEYTKSNAEAKS